MNFFLILYASIFWMSCTEPKSMPLDKEEPMGGACTYKNDYYRAVITSVSRNKLNEVDLSFVVLPAFLGELESPLEKGEPLADTLIYSQTNKQLISPAVFDTLNIKQGDTLQYLVRTIQSGACTPRIQLLELVKFKKE